MHPHSVSQGSRISYAFFLFSYQLFVFYFKCSWLSIFNSQCPYQAGPGVSSLIRRLVGYLSVLRLVCPTPPEGQAVSHLLSGRRTTCSFSPSKPNSPGALMLFLPWLLPQNVARQLPLFGKSHTQNMCSVLSRFSHTEAKLNQATKQPINHHHHHHHQN